VAVLNPGLTVGAHLVETLRFHLDLDRKAARRRAIELLQLVRVPDPERRIDEYPHQFSGGMAQRVGIALALACDPVLLIADEPTTALDVTTQAEVMAILDELRRERGLAMIFITHDLELAAAVCDRTAVMYAGQIVALGRSRDIEHDPLHPYTAALLGSRPRIDATLHRLDAIPGQPLSSFEAPVDACAFADRCVHATDVCRSSAPPLVVLDAGSSRCLRTDELRVALRGIDGATDG
jgi:oligopeptide/dipeptide ABC transporter ATP-binding protein